MNLNKIIAQFNTGINWNAGFYVLYKSISTFITFLLYRSLSTYDFTFWAICQSTLYIVLLWADCGLRKSLPRYCPVFTCNSSTNIRFLTYVMRFYVCLLLVASVAVAYSTKKVTLFYGDQHNTISFIIYCIPFLFFLEGMNTLFRLLFHAYFFVAHFNLIATIYLIIHGILDCCMIYTTTTSEQLLTYLFINKIVIGSCMLITSVSLFYYLKPYQELADQQEQPLDFKKTMYNFIRHTCMMWINTILKSLSERNSLVPIIALLAGAQSAALFKIANEGALLFQRVVLKTIGTSDTSFLAHIMARETGTKNTKLVQVAFTNLAQKMAALCFPLIGIVLFLGINVFYLYKTSMIFQLFMILTLCYLFEILLQPYERILEVQQSYKLLLIAYVPYALFGIYFGLYITKTWIGLLNFVVLVQCVRLVSLCCMVISVRYIYYVRYPLRYAFILCGYIVATSIGLYIVGNVVNIQSSVYRYIYELLL